MSVVLTANALPVSVVADTLKPTMKGKLMSYQYNPTAKEMRDAFFVAYGASGDAMMMGALFGHLQYKKPEYLEKLYQETLDKVKGDLVEKGLI